jgi:thiamine pyrophosphokinase
MTVLIFANGDLDETIWIRPYLATATAVIAADGGSQHLWRLGLLPDLVIGDMDSLPPAVRSWLAESDVPLVSHAQEKDETDLELALLHAVTSYEEDILVFAAFGGRLDQTLANILLLAHPALAQRRIELLTPNERAWLATAETNIQGENGDTISLIPLGGAVLVRQTSGLLYALKDEVLAFGPARGVSNMMTAELATVSVESGVLLCIHTRRAWQR